MSSFLASRIPASAISLIDDIGKHTRSQTPKRRLLKPEITYQPALQSFGLHRKGGTVPTSLPIEAPRITL